MVPNACSQAVPSVPTPNVAPNQDPDLGLQCSDPDPDPEGPRNFKKLDFLDFGFFEDFKVLGEPRGTRKNVFLKI